MNAKRAVVVGAGLAGSEAAWQLANRNIKVDLIDMKPEKKTPAHIGEGFAELCCSNSLRSDRMTNAVGLLKQEMRMLGSIIIQAADAVRIPAGGALAVDREGFSDYITQKLMTHENINFVSKEVNEIPDSPAIIATGPLTADGLAQAIKAQGMASLQFYDAAAPIVYLDSIDMGKVFRQSRYGRGDDYLNCPMTKDEYDKFVLNLINADTAPIHGFEEKKVFEGCMPVESMARRGHMSLAFGPMKPVGLIDPRTGKEAYAIVQLRQDNKEGTLYNLVGFQTRLTFPEQKKVFGMIPGLENAVFARYGVMHRNTFLHSPGFLSNTFEVLNQKDLYFAGQITGVEGYVESAASGLVAGINLARSLSQKEQIVFGKSTAIGGLCEYIATPRKDFQPMNCSFGLIEGLKTPPGQRPIRNKIKRYEAIAERSLAIMHDLVQKMQD